MFKMGTVITQQDSHHSQTDQTQTEVIIAQQHRVLQNDGRFWTGVFEPRMVDALREQKKQAKLG